MNFDRSPESNEDFLEKNANKNFLEILSLHKKFAQIVTKFGRDNLELEGDLDSKKNNENSLEALKVQYSDYLEQTGLSLDINSDYKLFGQKPFYYLNGTINLRDGEKFLTMLKNLDSSKIDKSKLDEFYFVLNSIISAAGDLYYKNEFDDRLIELKKSSSRLTKELQRIWSNKVNLSQHDILTFLHFYEDAFKDGYIKELYAIYKNDLFHSIDEVDTPAEYYEHHFSSFDERKDNEFEKNIEFEVIKDNIKFVTETSSMINKENFKKPVFKKSFLNIINLFVFYEKVIPLIKEKKLKEEYQKIVMENKLKITEKIKELGF